MGDNKIVVLEVSISSLFSVIDGIIDAGTLSTKERCSLRNALTTRGDILRDPVGSDYGRNMSLELAALRVENSTLRKRLTKMYDDNDSVEVSEEDDV